MHLFVDISAHGFGHLAQTAPVLNALVRETPLSLTVRCGHARAVLERRIHVPFTHIHEASDFGFVMHDALRIDLAASAARYREMHAHWAKLVENDLRIFEALEIDVVLSNVSPLPLAAAARADMPALALCSLNWADLFQHYFGALPWADEIHATLHSAYASADRFIRVTPGMPMSSLDNVQIAGTLAAPQPGNKAHVGAVLGAPLSQRWVLISMGGIAHRLPIEAWPRIPGVHFLAPAEWQITRDDCTPCDDQRIPFAELLASCDAVLTKPGYGIFAEAAVAGIPLLYLRRPDWPEEPYLIAWLQQHGRALEISPAAAEQGDLAETLATLWRVPAPTPPAADGVLAAARIILGSFATISSSQS